jgi:hypothetical protein
MQGRRLRPGHLGKCATTPRQWKNGTQSGSQSEGDFDAIVVVIEKLKMHGPALRFPHQSAVQGKGGAGLRELRPTQGRTLWRPLYRRFENTYVILAVGPEAQIDQGGFDSAVADAQARRKAIEDAL